MPRAKVILSNLLALSVEFYRRIEATKLLVLIADTKFRHDHDGDKVIQLIFERVRFWVWPFRSIVSLLVYLFSQAIAALFGEPEGLAGILERFFVPVQERVAIGQIEIGFGKWKQFLFARW